MKRALSLILVLVLALSLVACAKPADPTPTPDEGDTPAGPVVREVLNVGLNQDPAGFAPWGANTDGRLGAIWGIFEPLAYAENGELDYVLLKDLQISDDGLTVACTLHDNITDSAGVNLKASDVKFSFEKGAELGFVSNMGYVDEIEVTGDYTFNFNLNRKLGKGEIIWLLQSWNVVTEESYNASGDGMAEKPVGTGPYALTDYTANYMFTFTARGDEYWQPAEQANKWCQQPVKTINYYVLTESNQRTTALETGEIDICAYINAADLPMFDEGGDLSEEYWIHSYAGSRSLFLFPNFWEGKLLADNKDLRLAIFYAIDAATVIENQFGGRADPMFCCAPQWVADFEESWKTADNYYQENMDKAKEYLEKSGYNGEKLVVLTETTDLVNKYATLVHGMLVNFGLNAELMVVESTVMRQYMLSDEYDLLVSRQGCQGSYLVDAFLSAFDDAKWATGTTNNIADPELQRLLDIVRSAEGTQEDTIALHNYIIDNAYAKGMVNYHECIVASKDITDVAISWRKTLYAPGCTFAQ